MAEMPHLSLVAPDVSSLGCRDVALFVWAQGDNLCHHSLQGTATGSAWEHKGHWNLQKMCKGLGRFQHIIFLVVHRAGVSLALQYHLTMTLMVLKEFQCGFCTSHVSAWKVPAVWGCFSSPIQLNILKLQGENTGVSIYIRQDNLSSCSNEQQCGNYTLGGNLSNDWLGKMSQNLLFTKHDLFCCKPNINIYITYIKKVWSWEADERLPHKLLINPWPVSHLIEFFTE